MLLNYYKNCGQNDPRKWTSNSTIFTWCAPRGRLYPMRMRELKTKEHLKSVNSQQKKMRQAQKRSCHMAPLYSDKNRHNNLTLIPKGRFTKIDGSYPLNAKSFHLPFKSNERYHLYETETSWLSKVLITGNLNHNLNLNHTF